MTTLTGTYQLPDGTPAGGHVEIIPSEKKILDADGKVILSGRAKVNLDAAGHFSVDLPATDDPTLNPTGFGYTLVAKMNHTHLRPVSFSLPAEPATVDIVDLDTVDPASFTPGVTYATGTDLAGVADRVSELEAAPAPVTSWSELEDKPETFKPDVTDPDLSATIAAAVDGLGGGGSNSYAVDLMHTLDHDTGNAVLAVSGDSVSIESDGWVRRLTNKLAARYPKFTVIYKAKDGTNPTYAADVTVQTGTGGNGNTLTVYNWSQSGATVSIGYSDDATYSTAYPVQPDLFLIATGHNDWNVPTSEMYRYITDGAQRIARRHPGTPVAVVTMNPKNPAEPHYLHKFRTEQVKIAAAGQLGLGVLDLETAWIDRPGGYASLMADDIHPNAGGSELLATTAFDAFTKASPGGGDGQPRLVQQSLLVPIIGGVAGGGTPSAVAQGGYAQTYGVRFQHNSDDTWVCPPVLIPAAWASFSAELVWCVQGNSGAGEAFYLTVDYSCLSAGNNAPASLMFESTVAASSKPQGQTQVSTLVTDSPPHVPPAFAHVDGYPTPWAPWQFRIKRTSSHASDTLADGFGDILIYALRLTRVS